MRTEKEKKKRELFSTILWTAVLICMIVQIALPETGVLGMVKEGSYAILFFGIGGSCVRAIIQKWKKDKAAVVLGIFMLILTVGIGGWISRKFVLDLIGAENRSSDVNYDEGILRIEWNYFTPLLFMRKKMTMTSGRDIRWKFLRMNIMS